MTTSAVRLADALVAQQHRNDADEREQDQRVEDPLRRSRSSARKAVIGGHRITARRIQSAPTRKSTT